MSTSDIAAIKGGASAIPGVGTILGIGSGVKAIGSALGIGGTAHAGDLEQHYSNDRQTAPGQDGDPLLDAIELAKITNAQFWKDYTPAFFGLGLRGYAIKRATGQSDPILRDLVSRYLGADVAANFDDPANANDYAIQATYAGADGKNGTLTGFRGTPMVNTSASVVTKAGDAVSAAVNTGGSNMLLFAGVGIVLLVLLVRK